MSLFGTVGVFIEPEEVRQMCQLAQSYLSSAHNHSLQLKLTVLVFPIEN